LSAPTRLSWCGHVANVVHVEEKQRPAFLLLKRFSRPFHSVASQPVKIDPTLEVHFHMAWGGNCKTLRA
jgi:hypothetical protein